MTRKNFTPIEENVPEVIAEETITENVAPVVEAPVDQDGTNKTDDVAQIVAGILNDTNLEDDTAKWAMLMRVAASKIDESTITDLNMVSDAEIMRRLRLLWSKRVAAKKAGNLVDLAAIDEKEKELQAHRTKSASRRTGVVSGDTDPTKLDQYDLGKLIRNVQSKKSVAKKAGELDKVAELQVEEDKLKGLRTEAPKGAAANGMSAKIAETIAALEALEPSDTVAAQILMLKTLI